MSGHPPLHRQVSLDRSRSRQRPNNQRINVGYSSNHELDEIYRQRIDEAYYLKCMREILQDGCTPRPPFPVSMARLASHVYIGNQKNADDLEELYANRITHVINCAPSRLRRASTSDSPYPPETGVIGFKIIPAEDKEEYNIAKHFEETLEFLEQVKHRNGRALVHCNMGVNRSGAIIAAYLMASERRCLLEVIKYLKSKRSLVLTNKGFRRQLVKYARMKCLLDPIDDSEKNEYNVEYRRRRTNAFSTPQLRRAVFIDDNNTRTRSRQRNSYTSDDENDEMSSKHSKNPNWLKKDNSDVTLSSSFLSFLASNPKSFDGLDKSENSEFIVKSLPRNLSRINDNTSRQSPSSSSTTASYTRRSLGHLAAVDRDSSFPEYSQQSDNRIRKSIAYITPATKYTDEADGYHAYKVDNIYNGPVHSFHVDDSSSSSRPYDKVNSFSSTVNLTINHPHTASHQLNEFSLKTNKYNIPHHRIVPKSSPQEKPSQINTTSNSRSNLKSIDATTSEPKTSKKSSESRYSKQIKQHFNDFINMIRPNSNRSENNSWTAQQTSHEPKSGSSFNIRPIFIKKVEIKPVPSNKLSAYHHNLTSKELPSQQKSSSNEQQQQQSTFARYERYRSAVEPLKSENETTYLFSHVKPETHSKSIPQANFLYHPSSNPYGYKNDLTHKMFSSHAPTRETDNDRPYRRNNAGSLVFIGSRTSNIYPQNTPDQAHVSNVILLDDINRPTPRRLRAYVRSKTDSEIQ